MWFLGGLNNPPQLAPAEHCTVGGSKRTLGRIPPRGVGLTWLTTGPSRVRGDGSTLWVFWNKSALRADLRVFLSVGCRGLGCVVPRGPPTHASAGPWGAWIVGTSPHLLRNSDSLKEYEDAVCGSSGASTTHLRWPRWSIVPSGGQKGPSDAFPQGAWA